MDTIKSIIEMILFAIITGCGVAVLVKLLNVANAKIDELQTNTKLSQYTQLNKYIDACQDIIYNAVVSVSQTYVDSLKRDGKFDKAAQETAKNMAVDKIKELATDDMKYAVTTLRGDFNGYIDTVLEQVVRDIKASGK